MPRGVFANPKERGRKISGAHTGKKLSEETKRKISEAKKGMTGMTGKKHTEETKRKIGEANKITMNRPEVRKKMSEALTGRVFSEEWKKHLRAAMKIAMNRPEVRKKLSKALTGRKLTEEWVRKIGEAKKGNQYALGHVCSRETKRRMSESKKRSWQNSEYVEKQKEARNIKPNILEQKLGEILQQILPNEYKYVGDFSLTIGGKNPDFVNVNSQKKIIEFFGDYWHDKNSFLQAETPQERIALFKQYGWDTLIIWERELYDDVEKLKKRILKFHRKGALQKMFIGLKRRGQKILLGGKF